MYTITKHTTITPEQQYQLQFFGLWYCDLKEAGAVRAYLAWEGETIVAFQTVNRYNECVAIEVKYSHLGQGLSRLLIGNSNSKTPEYDANTPFWDYVKTW